MPVRITAVEDGSIAARLGLAAGDQILAVGGEAVADELDFRFKTAEETVALKVRQGGTIAEHTVEKDIDDPLGVDLEEFRIKTCGDDCVFCFVDQNPTGLRDTLYFRDGDFRMSFLYGNYITVTNLRERDLARIVEQRLSPLYISVHCTDTPTRRAMMGHRTQDDRLMEKLRFLAANDIELHAQIVMVPGYNDAGRLVETILDLYDLHEHLFSVSVVPGRHHGPPPRADGPPPGLAARGPAARAPRPPLARDLPRAHRPRLRLRLRRGVHPRRRGVPAGGRVRRLPADGERRRHEPRLPQRAGVPGRGLPGLAPRAPHADPRHGHAHRGPLARARGAAPGARRAT